MTKLSQTYPTDLKYTEWQLISDFFPACHLGRPREWGIWQLINAIFYWYRLKLIWADGGYPLIVAEVRQRFAWTLQIVKRSDEVKGFQVLPHRWVVGRTFGWLGSYRRLACDYEHTTLSSESTVHIASTRHLAFPEKTIFHRFFYIFI
jgi:transposase